MNRNTLLGAVLACSALAFGVLQFMTPQENADIKIDKKIEAPASTAEAEKKTTEVENAEADKQKTAADSNEKAVQSEAAKSEENTKTTQSIEDRKNDKSYIHIKKSDFKLYYYDKDGKLAFTAGCALGLNPGQKEKEGDMKTPTGTFYVDEILDASYWTHDFGDGKGVIEGAYGPWFISINTDEMSKGKWGGIGIHGTHDPASIGTRASEGCIRLENSQIDALKKLVSVGTKVVIEE